MARKTLAGTLVLLLAVCLAAPSLAGGREFFAKALKLQKEGDHGQAVEYFTKAIVSGTLSRKNRAVAFAKRGFSQYELAQYGEAVADCTKALEYDPNYAEAYISRGDALHKMSDYEGALADYTKALGIEPNNAALLHNRGATYLEMGDKDKALDDFKKSCSLGEEEACKVVEQLQAQQ